MGNWQDNPQTELEAAIREFKERFPGWWYSVCECNVSCDASCAPTSESEHVKLIRTDFQGSGPSEDPFDIGFHADIRQPSTLAEALRDVMHQALSEIEERNK